VENSVARAQSGDPTFPWSSIPYTVKGIDGTDHKFDLTHHRELKITSLNFQPKTFSTDAYAITQALANSGLFEVEGMAALMESGERCWGQQLFA
jgi:hypothetical protein